MPRRASLPALAIPIAAIAFLPACGEAPEPQAQTPAPDTASAPAQPRTEKAAVDAFNDYRLNASVGNASEALEHVHPSYFDVVRGHLDMALDADRQDIARMSFADRYMVLTLRVRLDPERLRTITPRELAEMAIEKGWIQDEIMRDATVESVALHPDDGAPPWAAEIRASAMGRTIPTTFPMIYEGGRWRVDLKRLLERSRGSMDRMEQMLGEDADAIIIRGAAAKDGRPIPENIYAPIGR